MLWTTVFQKHFKWTTAITSNIRSKFWSFQKPLFIWLPIPVKYFCLVCNKAGSFWYWRSLRTQEPCKSCEFNRAQEQLLSSAFAYLLPSLTFNYYVFLFSIKILALNQFVLLFQWETLVAEELSFHQISLKTRNNTITKMQSNFFFCKPAWNTLFTYSKIFRY